MDTGAVVLIVAVALAVVVGLWRAARDGRFSGTHEVKGAGVASEPEITEETSVLAGTPWAEELGERVTLLQFSSAFCAPCRATRVVLADVASADPGVAHLEVDAEKHLDLVRRLGVLRTPTTLILDARGVERARAAGAPRREAVERSIAAVSE